MRPTWAIVALCAVAYPLVSLAGGSPRFPSRADCLRPASDSGPIEAVFGTFDTMRDAGAFRDRIARFGWASAVVEPNSCGRIDVAVHGIATLKDGQGLLAEAHSVGLHPTLAQAG